MMWENALPDLLTEEGLRTLEPTNRLADDESCQLHAVPEKEDISALLRALYAPAAQRVAEPGRQHPDLYAARGGRLHHPPERRAPCA